MELSLAISPLACVNIVKLFQFSCLARVSEPTFFRYHNQTRGLCMCWVRMMFLSSQIQAIIPSHYLHVSPLMTDHFQLLWNSSTLSCVQVSDHTRAGFSGKLRHWIWIIKDAVRSNAPLNAYHNSTQQRRERGGGVESSNKVSGENMNRCLVELTGQGERKCVFSPSWAIKMTIECLDEGKNRSC